MKKDIFSFIFSTRVRYPIFALLWFRLFRIKVFLNYYRPQTKFAKVMFLHLSVSHSVHRGGVCPSACWDAPPGPEADPPEDPPRDQRQTPPPVQCMLEDTRNKRAVRILLDASKQFRDSLPSSSGNDFSLISVPLQYST